MDGKTIEGLEPHDRLAWLKAELDQWPKFERAYDALRASLIDEGVKAEAAGERF